MVASHERNRDFLQSLCLVTDDPVAPQDAPRTTAVRTRWSSENVPVLRIDHVSTESKLPGVRNPFIALSGHAGRTADRFNLAKEILNEEHQIHRENETK